MTEYTELKRLAEAATQGGWQVIETELPCRIGRPHVERRIFTAKDHPQLKAPYPVVNGSIALVTDETPVHHMVSMTAEDAAYIAAANPSAVLALIAENERLKTLRSVTERDLAQELEVWRHGPSCWNCGDTGDVHDMAGEWLGQCDCNAAKLIDISSERDQLRAEVAGLKTGYEAYERVNAELMGEVEGLRNALRPLLAHWDDLRPGESINVDAARAALGQGEQS